MCLVPDNEIPAKLNDLCKLCSSSKLIPDSMRLPDNSNETLKATEYIYPSLIFQSEFRGRKVAVKVVRLYVPQKPNEPLSVGVHPPQILLGNYD